MSALNDTVFIEAASRIARSKRPLLVTHTNPDGDALGSLVAMRSVLRAKGVDALAVLFHPLPRRYAYFSRYDPLPVLELDVKDEDLSLVDAVMLLDTCTYSQLRPIKAWLRVAQVYKIAVDHHITRDDVADLYVVDESAAANCLILYDWLRAVDWPLDEETRDALFIGIAMDTGWFRFSNADDRALAAAADLVARGVSPHRLHQQLFQQEASGRVRLLAEALNTMELLCDDRLGVMTLSGESFTRAGAAHEDTEDIVNEPLRIGSVVVSVLLVERGDGVVRSSFRSKPPVDESSPGIDVDVATVAQTFGGGGHRRAAGARITGTLPDVRKAVVDRLREALNE